jgi:uncharacterized protein
MPTMAVGTGIIIAFATTVTLLPALLTVLKPPGEQKPIGYAALAPLDRFLERQRNWIVGLTLAATILGLPLLADLRFDFNPLNLRPQDSESISTLLELMNDPDTTPNTIEVLKSSLAEALPVAERLRQLPEVGRVLTPRLPLITGSDPLASVAERDLCSRQQNWEHCHAPILFPYRR